MAAHAWVGAALVDLTDREAELADLRGVVRLTESPTGPAAGGEEPDPPRPRRIHILETYCHVCRRAWEDVADQPCLAVESNTHLIGGPGPEHRRPRTHTHDCQAFGCYGTGIPNSTLVVEAALAAAAASLR